MLRGEFLLQEEYPTVERKEASALTSEVAEPRHRIAEDFLRAVEVTANSQHQSVQAFVGVEIQKSLRGDLI